MFCKKCGKEVAEGIKFCPGCGTAVGGGSAAPVVESKDPIITTKPNFILKLFLLQNWPFFIAITVSVLLTLAAIEFMFYTIVLLAVYVGYFFVRKNTYAKTTYSFFNTKLDYFEGFLTVEEKTIKYDRITEVNLRKGFFQRMFGVGTIILSTPATAGGGGGANTGMAVLGGLLGAGASGIHILDIKNPDEVYAKVKGLIRKR